MSSRASAAAARNARSSAIDDEALARPARYSRTAISHCSCQLKKTLSPALTFALAPMSAARSGTTAEKVSSWMLMSSDARLQNSTTSSKVSSFSGASTSICMARCSILALVRCFLRSVCTHCRLNAAAGCARCITEWRSPTR